MKKIYFAIAALASLVSCQSLKEEFQPVFTFRYDDPEEEKIWTKDEVEAIYGPVKTIAQLAGSYVIGTPVELGEGTVISGIISTTDQPGNFYKSFYIQDETGGMEIKAGKNGLYNDYRPGQRVYIVSDDSKGITMGMYGYKTGNYGGMGMVQIGGKRNIKEDGTNSDEYETSYIENAFVLHQHILKGEMEGEVTPVEINESDLPGETKGMTTAYTPKDNKYIGRLVTLRGLKYANQIFALMYLDSNKDKKASDNRIFLSDTNGLEEDGKTHKVTTWAMSKNKMTEYMLAGYWDSCRVGSGSEENFPKDEDGNFITVGSLKGGNGQYDAIEKAAVSVSHYFKMGSREIQIRTSGFSKFADREIPEDVLHNNKSIDVTGVLTLYQGSIQITVNNISDFTVDGQPLE